MSSTLRTATKTLVMGIPIAREIYFKRAFLRRSPACKGTFASFEEARAAIPSEFPQSTTHDLSESRLDYLNPGDYPVLFWLSRLLPDARLVFELGGGIGLGYFAYRRYLLLPSGLSWVICEMPDVVEAGREVARKRNDGQLIFTDQREEESDPDIYLTSGTLQYIEEPFGGIISQLRRLPPHVLVNRVPFSSGTAYITLQHSGNCFSPYKVGNRSEFIESLEALNYELVDAWDTDRPVSFLLHPEYETPRYYGMYFRLK